MIYYLTQNFIFHFRSSSFPTTRRLAGEQRNPPLPGEGKKRSFGRRWRRKVERGISKVSARSGQFPLFYLQIVERLGFYLTGMCTLEQWSVAPIYLFATINWWCHISFPLKLVLKESFVKDVSLKDTRYSAKRFFWNTPWTSLRV